jgi:hypothetical protein
MNKHQAEQIVKRKVLSKLPDCDLVEEAAQEFDTCFAVYYQSKTYLQSGRFIDMLVGHGPVLVEKTSGQVFTTGSAYSTKEYVTAFEACGDPFGEPTASIQMVGWHKEGDRTQALRCLKKYTGYGITEVTLYLESVISGQEVIVHMETSETAMEAADELRAIGLDSKQLWKKRRYGNM